MIIVTGGAGFIGSNLISALKNRGLGPVVLCDTFGEDSRWKNLVNSGFDVWVAPDELMGWLDMNGSDVDAVFHMGAVSTTTETDVDYIMNNNFSFTMELWHWCANMGKRFIYASSAATYGAGEHGFIDDNNLEYLEKLRPLNPYGWSKALTDVNVMKLANDGHAPSQWVGLKFFNVYGPNEYHKNGQQSVVEQVFQTIKTTGKATLFQSHNPDYEDGGQLRDFVYVKDLAKVMIWLYDNPHVNGLYNLGTGHARSFKDLATSVFQALGQTVDIDYVPTPDHIARHYQYYTQADMNRLHDAGYDIPFTTLEKGVADYVQNYLNTENPYG